MGAAIAASVGIAVVGAVVWALLAYLVNVRIAFVGIGVAYGIVWALRRFGARPSQGLAVFAGLLTLGSCFLGHWFEGYALVSKELDVSLFRVIERLPLSLAWDLWLRTTSPITWVIFAFAGFYGYRGVAMWEAADRHSRALLPPAAYPPPAPYQPQDAYPPPEGPPST
jgi:hypothetical protein